MPIESLPSSTITSIGSTQCLTDPNSLVKELVDNALDARAISVFVEISTNTLDKIQVKDNGHGIVAEDRALVGKRHCTSKIRDLEDLRNLGGQSLGFRGEALASALELSGSLIITTRVEGEPTATEISFEAKGGAGPGKPVSHPIGTTVTIKDFLKNIPVRRQTALKEKVAASQLTKIKATLQAYAIARPCTRFTLKVLKARSEKGNFSYAPTSTTDTKDVTSIREAAIKLLGTKAVDSCKCVVVKADHADGKEHFQVVDVGVVELNEDDDFLLQALIPSPDTISDFTGAEKPRQYISVDGRPVSIVRGTFKQIVKRCKKAFLSAVDLGAVDKTNEPVVCLNIHCRRGSYDPNVEPTKDDVLFEDPDYLLRAVDYMLAEVYGQSSKDAKREVQEIELSKTQDPDLLLSSSKRRSQIETQWVDDIAGLHNESNLSVLPQRLLLHEDLGVSPHNRNGHLGRSSMYDDGEDDASSETLGEADMLLRREAEEDDSCTKEFIATSNPFAIAKMNAAFRNASSKPSRHVDAAVTNGLQTPQRQRGEIQTSPIADLITSDSGAHHTSPQHMLLSPEASSPPLFPFPHQIRNRKFDGERSRPDGRQSSPQQELDEALERSTSLDGGHMEGGIEGLHQNRNKHDGHGFVSARAAHSGMPLSMIPNGPRRQAPKPRGQQRGSKTLTKPFVSPVNDPQKVWFDVADQNGSQAQRHRHRKPMQQARQTGALNLRDMNSQSPLPDHPDLAETMDYEARKQQALQNYKKQKLRQTLLEAKLPSRPAGSLSSELNTPTMLPLLHGSPHHNRYLKAKAALQSTSSISSTGMRSPSPPTLQPDDPRSVLIRERHGPTNDRDEHGRPRAHTGKRTKTAMLPLENVREGDSVRELVRVLSVSVEEVERVRAQVALWDRFVADGEDVEGFDGMGVEGKEVERWEGVLEGLVRGRYGAGEGEEVKIDLRSVFLDGLA